MKLENAEKVMRVLDRLTALHLGISREYAELAAEEARESAPERSGRLRESIGIRRSRRGFEVVMGGSKAPYAAFLEYGTRPHVIRASRARALRFEVDGKIVYARYVSHPGIRPKRIIAGAEASASRKLDRIVSSFIDRSAMRKIL